MRSLPIIFSQREYTQRLGFDPNLTIADAGCFLTSLAMVSRAYGKDTDPVELNEALQQHGGFVPGSGLIASDSVLQTIFPDILYLQSYDFPNDPPTPADLDKLKELMSDTTLSVILEITLPGGHTHFAVCLGVNGVVTIANPWTRQVEDFGKFYGDPVRNIIKFIVYRSTPVSVDQQSVDNLRGQRDTNWNLYQGQLANLAQIQEQLTKLQDQANGFQIKNNDLETENAKLKTDYKSISDDYSGMLSKYQAKLKEDVLAVDIGIKAPNVISDLRQYLKALAENLKITTSQKTDKQIADETLNQQDRLKQEEAMLLRAQYISRNYNIILKYLNSKGLGEYLKTKQLTPESAMAGEAIAHYLNIYQLPQSNSPIRQNTGFFSHPLRFLFTRLFT